MPYTVTSKFTTVFRIKAVIFTLFILVSTGLSIEGCISNYEAYNWGEMGSIALYSMLVIGIYVNVAINSLKNITAAPEGIILYYLLTKKQIIVDYADIVHVSNYRINGNYDSPLLPSHLKLDIELSTGEDIVFTNTDIDNYDELKEAIREYRFKLI
jgi:hypothetical protein